MTATSLTGAASNLFDWDTINWAKVETEVLRLQMRIAKALREEKYNRVKALQRLLTTSFYGKLLAVRKITRNKGKKYSWN